jgi:hypothetical protein
VSKSEQPAKILQSSDEPVQKEQLGKPFLTIEEARAHDAQVIDYLKHVTTLSTGSLVLEIGFLEKAFPNPQWKSLAALSLISFVLSIVASVRVYAGILNSRSRRVNPAETKVLKSGSYLSWMGFLLGIILLSLFGLKNLNLGF